MKILNNIGRCQILCGGFLFLLRGSWGVSPATHSARSFPPKIFSAKGGGPAPNSTNTGIFGSKKLFLALFNLFVPLLDKKEIWIPHIDFVLLKMK